MQYMLLIYEPESAYQGEAGERRLTEIVAKHMALAEELIAAGVQTGGAGLQGVDTATTVVTQGGRQTLHDGPFAETHEQLGGYYMIEVDDLDQALAIARRVPVAEGGKVEVRPLMREDG
ncbi:YciI family protein [Phenylobacterium deserti]|uniref:YciI family protein n=2 Tax=Phenylobacterium deserti TaxID=1914756 RepID=A0A328AD42_9CAUL|nr:YciI family protein [Phenylobacterium deserti]